MQILTSLIRFVFLLFEQSQEFATQTVVNDMTPRENFNISTFADEMQLGDPIGGTFIVVAPDPPPPASG
jgi:phosphatidylethanolamine-binding protein